MYIKNINQLAKSEIFRNRATAQPVRRHKNESNTETRKTRRTIVYPPD